MVFFNTPEVEMTQEFEVLPAGGYRVAVIDSQYDATRKGDGMVLKVALQLMEGPHKGQRVFANFNIENPSERAQQIGRSQFKRFLHAIGITEILRDVQDCHSKIANKTLWVDVDQEAGTDGKTRNVVKRYDSVQGVSTAPNTTSKASGTASGVSRSVLDDVPF